MKEHEKKKIRENTDFEPSSLKWKAIGRDPNEAEASDNNARFINIQTEKNHSFGKLSAGHGDYRTNTHDMCKRETDMKTEPTDYSLTPPELTDSEGEYDSESETEDSMPAERHPSGTLHQQ